jgi:transcriptional regulator with XRE-family HTH domain
MNDYGRELKRRREVAGMTVRALGDLIERSGTFVTNFELGKTSNPPEPAMMARLAEALRWPVSEQLAAWGYAVESAPQALVNPFEPGDIRHRIVEEMRAIDMDGPDGGFWRQHFTVESWLYRDMRAGLGDDLADLESARQSIATSDYELTLDQNETA